MLKFQEKTYYDCYHLLYRPILLMIHDHALTEDIIQETFVKLLRHTGQMHNEEHLRSWIKVVAKNTAIDFLRKRKKFRNDVSMENLICCDKSNPAVNVEKEFELQALLEQISHFLSEMIPEHRRILELKWKDGMSYKEIALEIQDTENNIKRKLHQSRLKLKQKLNNYWRDN
jgi:RNA polymerase sigma-70 factor (ECF subfamily)